MRSLRSIARGVLAVLMLTSLAACTPDAPSLPEVVPSPSSTPTVTAEPARDPEPRIPLSCDELIPPARASAAVGVAVVLGTGAQERSNIGLIAAAQAGATACTWDPAGQWSWKHTLAVSALADAADEFAARTVYGDDTEPCTVDASGEYCTTQQLIGTTWLSVASRVPGSTASLEEVRARWDALLAEVVRSIEAVGDLRPVWHPPASATALGFCAGRPVDPYFSMPASSPIAAASSRLVTNCSDGEWFVSILVGGAWAMPDLVAERPDSNYEVGRWQPFEVAGADAALWVCGDGCSVIASVGGTLVSIGRGDLDPDSFPAEAATELQAVIASR